MPYKLTKSEEKAIELLKKAAKHWPGSLWLFAAGNQLHVMRKDKFGKIAMESNGSIDQDFVLESINIEADGGDW